MTKLISASVGQNGVNRSHDVITVQQLLNKAPIMEGGPSPTLKVDGLCWSKTTAAIGKFQKIRCGFQWPDQLIAPAGRTWSQLVLYDDMSYGPDVIHCFPKNSVESHRYLYMARSGSMATPDALVADAMGVTPIAITWTAATRSRLQMVNKRMERFKIYDQRDRDLFEPFYIHFKIDIPTLEYYEANSRIEKLIKNYGWIYDVLTSINRYLRGDPSVSDNALAPLGAYQLPFWQNEHKWIMIGSGFTNCTTNMKAAVLIHECAHFVDRMCGHVASELPAPQGSAIADNSGRSTNPSQKNYASMNWELAVRNAYSFAQCALHCGLWSDKRPP